jgi:hypothetical protein
VLVLTASLLALTMGLSIPGVAFFLYLLAGVSAVFFLGIWNAVPSAQSDEAFLLGWIGRVTQPGYPPFAGR